MANLSAETQAIIDRLKTEGDLIRNSGTNSVRSVKMQLDKFENIFSTISANVVEQTKILQMQAGIAQEAVEAQRTRDQLEEIQTKAQEEKDSSSNDNSKEPKWVESFGNSIQNAFSARSILSTMKDLAIAGAGIFVGYNLLKGYVDESTGGGWSRMEETIKTTDWTGLATGVGNTVKGMGQIGWGRVASAANTVVTAVEDINWGEFTTAVNEMSSSVIKFKTWLGDTGIDDIVMKVAGAGLFGVGVRGAVMGALRSGGPGGVGMAARLAGVGPALAIAAGGLGIYYGDEIGAWINNQVGTGLPEDALGTEVKLASGVFTALSMFGPYGALAGVVIGGGIILGGLMRNWIRARNERSQAEFNAAADAALAKAREEGGGENMSEDTAAEVARMAAEAARRTQLAINNAALEEAERTQAELQAELARRRMDQTDGVNELQIAETRAAAMAGDPEAIAELLAWAEGRTADTNYDSWWNRMRGNTRAGDIRSLIQGLDAPMPEYSARDPEGYRQAMDQWQADQERWDQISDQILTNHGYRRGTRGFKNFGSGTISILHGKEAVVPYDSPEGRILDRLYSQQRPADVVSTGSGAGGAPIVIQPVNIGGSTISLADGGKSVSMINVGGGGGGIDGSSMIPYGLTGAFS